jgi:beta-lactamase class A
MSGTTDWSAVEDVVRKAEASGGTVGVTLVAPNGDRYTHNGDRKIGAASTVKIPLMIEVYRQVDRGERALDDPYTLVDADRAPGSGVMLDLHTGMVFTLNDLIYLMISISDNTATNILIDYTGMEQVTATMRELGMKHSQLGRKMKGRLAQGDEQENWGTANDYISVLQAVLDGRAASADSCAKMVAMLEKQQNKRRISRYLPDAEGTRWGSKTGSVTGVTNDVGFITTDKGTLLISIFCENLPDVHVGEQVIGDVTRVALEATGVAEPLRTS